jgi:hypothetical protein
MMKFLKIFILAFTLICAVMPAFAGNMVIGMNLNGVSDWSSEWPFVDIMKISRSWFTFNADGSGGWDSGFASSIPLDANLYPAQAPFDPDGAGPAVPQAVRTVWAISRLPTGGYTFICDGTGVVSFHGMMSGSFTVTNGGTFIVNIAGDGNAWMDITQSQQGNNLRNMRLIMPGFTATYQTNRFHPSFISSISYFKALRFMDWGATNGSGLVNWADRPKPGDYSYALKGVPYEVMIELANKLNLPPWICVPHRATDDYITQLVRVLRDNLNSNLKIYLEYSNETWNGSFTQAAYCETQGGLLGLPSFYGYRWAYHCKRACDIWRIFIQEFGSDARLVKLIATQVGWGSGTVPDPYPAQFMLNTAMASPLVNPDNYHADALAIAPYFAAAGMDSLPNTTTVNDVLTLCQQDIDSMTSAGGMVPGHKAVAAAYGAELICYEGGQSLVNSSSDTLTATFIAANRDPGIYGIYIDYLNKLDASGVSLFNHFSDCGGWSKWGMWGSMEYQDEPLANAHKYRALLDWQNVASSRTPTITPTVTITPTPAPVTHLDKVKAQPSLCNAGKGCAKIVFTGLSAFTHLRIYDINGGLVYKADTATPAGTIDWIIDKRAKSGKTARGVYLYIIINENKEIARDRVAIIR